MKILDNIYVILDEMQKRKAMYLGNDYNFQSLESFVYGYQLAASDQHLEQSGAPNFGYFNTWILGHISEHYGLSGGWFWQIRNRNLNDDAKAFDDFFDLLSVFKKSGIYFKKAIVNARARDFSITGPVKRYVGSNFDEPDQVPHSIRWTRIGNSTTTWISFLDATNKVFSESWYENEKEATNALDSEFGGYLDFF